MYVVPRPGERWELRESRNTDKGPRSRTLVSFSVLTPAVIAHAAARAGRPLDAAGLRRAALRAGAPVQEDSGEVASRELLTAIAQGRPPARHWQRLLQAALSDAPPGEPLSASERAGLAWIGSTPAERGRALVDLLRLVDALPSHTSSRARRPPPLQFPRLGTRLSREL